MKHLMLDIETLGNQSYSAILSIGAIEFDINTGETGKEFNEIIDLQSSVDLGLVINASTVVWWMQQSEDARNRLFKSNGTPIKDVLTEFCKFCNKEYQIWGNSARFDCGILQNAYNKANIPIPWDFRKERCLRTLVSFKPEIKEKYNRVGVDHDALDDCRNQIGYCCEIWKTLQTER